MQRSSLKHVTEYAMTADKLKRFRRNLEELGRKLTGTSRILEGETLRAASGEAAGELSNVPMHLADVGTEAFTHELNSTLLENEEFIGREVDDALTRLEKGRFGLCEECSKEIPMERLEVLPYARYCAPCTETLQAGGKANLNVGRPSEWGSTFEHSSAASNQRRGGEGAPASTNQEDVHAAGTAGGGTALGGLAGTNVGDGTPDDEPLENAMGSGR